MRFNVARNGSATGEEEGFALGANGYVAFGGQPQGGSPLDRNRDRIVIRNRTNSPNALWIDSGNITLASGQVFSTSDERLKQSISTIPDGAVLGDDAADEVYTKFSQIKPKVYTRKDTG